MIILDTNVLSELTRAAPTPSVRDWVDAQPIGELFTTAVTQAEIMAGVALLPQGRRKDQLAGFAAAIFARDFAGRVLPFDGNAAVVYAEIVAARRRAGRPIPAFDAQIAAIAGSRQAALATRNVTDFTGCGVGLYDPWTGTRA